MVNKLALSILAFLFLFGAASSTNLSAATPNDESPHNATTITFPDRPEANIGAIPPVAWEDFYGTKRTADIPDAIRSFIIAVQVCHYFTNFDKRGLSGADKQYVEANIAENCRDLSGRETALTEQFADNPVGLKAIEQVVASPERPDKPWTDNFNTPRSAAIAEEVRPFIIRRQGCDHFRGEPAYNEERRKFLVQQMEKLCTGTDAELKRLREKYADQVDTIEALAVFEDCIEYATKCDEKPLDDYLQ